MPGTGNWRRLEWMRSLEQHIKTKPPWENICEVSEEFFLETMKGRILSRTAAAVCAMTKEDIRKIAEESAAEVKDIADLMDNPEAFNAWMDENFGSEEDNKELAAAFAPAPAPAAPAAAAPPPQAASIEKMLDPLGNVIYRIPRLDEWGKVAGNVYFWMSATEYADVERALVDKSRAKLEEMIPYLQYRFHGHGRKRTRQWSTVRGPGLAAEDG
ncbi:hypothetical protein LTR56_003912 [Elasticomyces elasticus]|nr:hypothetical protein LTR56_003912 [Elasticomyces elasticus]KAK3661102.1 hypothetical protein LTR22_007728 [Elasticomyces elasticus]KAK4921108.1 hypothetical protein LTR49_011478 [Elasticomyces elasticus]KAK5748547.1 hypothetical protein LTS12_021391 [Elasticomyces elasticus]